MNRKSLTHMALATALLFLVACNGTGSSKNTALVKPDQSRIAFFHRPVALAAARASAKPYPLIVMLTADPWLMVTGSDSPAFALYSDGTAIFLTKAGFKSAKLNQGQQADLLRPFENPDLVALAGGYVVADATDQPESTLLVYGNNEPYYISVYGPLNDKFVRSKVPLAISDAFDRLQNFRPSASQAWLPDKVEVMAGPYENAPDQSIIWPQRWPDLNDPATRTRGDSYSIFMASTELPALKTFLASRKEKGAVEINGKKFSVSVRLPFPHEELWMATATK
ncbi:hypothetical protein [Sphingobium sp. CR28]|uniref:hypothetical protein n=1 Tax=Sphingobium sp. CR28 TaxID=3400272 RepID=UPI003FEDE4A0